MHKEGVDAVLDRLKDVFRVSTDSELARALNSSAQTVSSWRARNSVPYAICVQIANDRGLSLDWLIRGIQDEHVKATSGNDDLTPRERILLDLFNGLNPDIQQEVLRDASEKQRIVEMENQLAKLQAEMEVLKKSV